MVIQVNRRSGASDGKTNKRGSDSFPNSRTYSHFYGNTDSLNLNLGPRNDNEAILKQD